MKPFIDIGDKKGQKHFYDESGHELLEKKEGTQRSLYINLAGSFVFMGSIQNNGPISLEKLYKYITA